MHPEFGSKFMYGPPDDPMGGGQSQEDENLPSDEAKNTEPILKYTKYNPEKGVNEAKISHKGGLRNLSLKVAEIELANALEAVPLAQNFIAGYENLPNVVKYADKSVGNVAQEAEDLHQAEIDLKQAQQDIIKLEEFIRDLPSMLGGVNVD